MPEVKTTVNSKRIARNTGMLYVRMLVMMLINLVTIRYLLQALGAEDYGIFHLVAGLVALFGLLSGVISGTCQRYLSIALGKGDAELFNRYFRLNMLLYIGIALIVIIIAEPVGLGMINYTLNIPATRLTATNWIFQFSLLAFFMKIISTPYMAAINAYEKMDIYAWLSLLDAAFRLAIVGLLWIVPTDKLILYGGLLYAQSIIMWFIYRAYSIKHCPGTCFSFYWNRQLAGEMFNFTGWNVLGSFSYLMRTQGISILLNLFFGPLANAAKGISDRINDIIKNFIDNFYAAISPQLMKLYAAGEKEQMRRLAYRSSKFSFFLMWLMALPLILEVPFLLRLWLGNVEELWISFTRLTLLFLALQILEPPISKMLMAVGHIKYYQLWVSLFTLLSIPLCYLVYHLGGPPQSCFYVLISIYTLAYIPRLLILRKELGFSLKDYLRQVALPCVRVASTSIILPLYLYYLLGSNFWPAVIVGLSAAGCVALSSLYLGMLREERLWLKTSIATIYHNKIRRA